MEIITSRSNPKIKMARALQQRKNRQEARLFLAEGIRHVGEALEAGARFEGIYFTPERLKSSFGLGLVVRAAAAGIPVYAVTPEVFETIGEKENPQGILAVLRQNDPKLDDFGAGNFPWGVAVIAPQDPGNVGAVLRTIDAVGASGLILLDGGVDAYHPSAVRASMGALFWLPVIQADFETFRNWAGVGGYAVYGSSARAEVDYRQAIPYRRPCILLLGSEREGLSDEQRRACNEIVSLPMHGRASSLNLAVAAGVLLYAMREGIT